ncbi:MAG: tetratricopeptide repeat protein [Thermoanaerobaculia bacterium]
MTRRLLLVFVLAGVATTACSPRPRPVDSSSPEARAAALATRAEREAAEGRLRDALDGYREAARLVPEEDRYRERVAELRAAFVTSLRDEAEPALARGDLPSARRAALVLVEVDPDSPAGYHVLAAAAEAEGKLEDAWAAGRTAHERAPSDVALTEALAALAMKTARFAEAEALYGDLAKSDPAMVEKQAAARLEFQVQNLPPLARKAVGAPRVTRAQLATLLVTLVPEVSSARVPPGADVATDILDRPERNALVRAIALGFFAVSRETHHVGADVPVPRSEMPGHLRRVAALRGDPEDDCLVAPAALANCGILPETASRQVSGREAFAAIDATVRLAR